MTRQLPRPPTLSTRAVGAALVATWLWSTDSIDVAQGLSCSEACGSFPDQGWKLSLLHWQLDSLPPGHQGSPGGMFSGWECIGKKSLTADGLGRAGAGAMRQAKRKKVM